MQNRNLRYAAVVFAVTTILSSGASAADKTAKVSKKDAVYSGPAKKFGEGSAHSYVKLEQGKIVEIGVTFSEKTLQSLQAGPKWQPGHHHEYHEYSLELPQEVSVTPFRFIELDWNPGGHEPPGVYDTGHLDFHFYFISKEERDAIDPEKDPEYKVKASRQPAAELIPAGYIAPPGTDVPRMGVHWVDRDSPELHGAPFTQTLIRGSWDGKVTFIEPMINRDYLLTKPNVVFPVSQPKCVDAANSSPRQYGIRYDKSSHEYQVYMTAFAPKSCPAVATEATD